MPIPNRLEFKQDTITKTVISEVKRRFRGNFGSLDKFNFAVDGKSARRALKYFIQHLLPNFGNYQDALVQNEDTLFHSLISPYLNVGLLSPREVCNAAEEAFQHGKIPLASAEGFIRQILGWREFIRGVYWYKMPGYKKLNALNAKEPLPDLYWTGETDMACVRHAIRQTEAIAYAHHIQRLMVTGNLALLLGVLPEAICEWYLIVYIDAFDWVELPNTLGMSQFGDGGVFATKPYASSGNYINKQSDYCKNCKYDVKQKTSEEACPFNYLYWDFMIRHDKKFRANQRMKFVYATLDKMDDGQKKTLRTRARAFRKSLK